MTRACTQKVDSHSVAKHSCGPVHDIASLIDLLHVCKAQATSLTMPDGLVTGMLLLLLMMRNRATAHCIRRQSMPQTCNML